MDGIYVFLVAALISSAPLSESLQFSYVQEYFTVESAKGLQEHLSSKVEGIVSLAPYLAGDELQWIVSLKDFKISFFDDNPEILELSCNVFVANPVLNTLLVEEDELSSCPDELKSQISAALFSDGIHKETPELMNFVSFSDAKCPPVTRSNRTEGNSCLIETKVESLNDCTLSAPGKSEVTSRYVKRNFTIRAEFDKCDLVVTNLKELRTERFYEGREGGFIRILERFGQLESETKDGRHTPLPGTVIDLNASEPSWKWFETYSKIVKTHELPPAL